MSSWWHRVFSPAVPRPRRRQHLERELRPVRRWRIYAQVETTSLVACSLMHKREGLVRELPELETESGLVAAGELRKNAGVAFVLHASSEQNALRAGRRQLERLHLEPLVLRARPATRR